MYNFPNDKQKKTIDNVFEPTVDEGYRPWDVDWRDKHIYGTVEKSWEEMTPQERIKELNEQEFSERYGLDYQINSRNSSKGFEIKQELNPREFPEKSGFNNRKFSKNSSKGFDFIDWLILGIFLLGIVCMAITYAF